MKQFKQYITESVTKESIIADGIKRLTNAYKKHGGMDEYQGWGRSWAAIDKIEDGIQKRLEAVGIPAKEAFSIVFGTIRSAATKAHKEGDTR